jgi:L-malate glycosyltransferase
VTAKRVLHCHSIFSLGGKEARAVRLMNAFGGQAEHVILSAVPGALDARAAIDPAVRVAFPGDAAPRLDGPPGIARYRALSAYMRAFDLVLTYNWGAMDAVGARRLFPAGCPPLIHHEDGFNADEAVRLNTKRNTFRRLMLPTAKALVVPSQRLETIARTVWKQPDQRLIRIPNGIDTARYVRPPEPGSIPGLVRNAGDLVVGTLAGLRPVKNLRRLIRAVAAQSTSVKLAIVGDGPERATLLDEATRLGLSDRLIMPGFLADPSRYLGHFDVFALSSDSEQFPISIVEAMAAGLPIIATDVGDVRAMVSAANTPYIVPASNEPGFASALGQLLSDADLRASLGMANAAKAAEVYREQAMIGAYATLYGLTPP